MERIKKIWKIIDTRYFIVSVVIVIGLIGTYRSCTVKEEGIYTIATIYNTRSGRGGTAYDYTYIYNGKEYNNYAISPEKKISDNGVRFFVQVLENDPARCQMTDIRVPDSIAEAPYEGWKELPVPVQE